MWTCAKCGEQHDDQFDSCWKCAGAPRPTPGPLRCLRCPANLGYVGTKKFHEGTSWGVLDGIIEHFTHREGFDVYVCPRCGRVELFVNGMGEDSGRESQARTQAPNVVEKQMRESGDKVSMQEFLRTGRLGPIALGDSADHLRAAFGEPHEVGGTSRRRRKPGIWKYGDVEFHLTEDDRIRLIFCDTFHELQLGLRSSFDRWFFTGHPSVESVERELAAAGLTFRRRDLPHEPNVFCLRLDSGVELLFCRENEPAMWPGVPGLFGFQYVLPD